jgi:hypothetical protein
LLPVIIPASVPILGFSFIKLYASCPDYMLVKTLDFIAGIAYFEGYDIRQKE